MLPEFENIQLLTMLPGESPACKGRSMMIAARKASNVGREKLNAPPAPRRVRWSCI
jgi:hypothetical protein